MATETYRGTPADASALISRIPRMLAGIEPDTANIVRGIRLRVGVACLSQIQQDFITKSRGGIGRDGIKWPPLKPATIAARRTSAAERKSLGIAKNTVRGLLTPAQDKRWRGIFASTFARLRLVMGDGAAKAQAAATAWAILKREGAKTRIGTLGNRDVDILRDTSVMFRSISPGVEDRPSGADGQIFRVEPDSVVVGTSEKPWHQRGNNRLPARPIWPADDTIPPAWWPAIVDAAKTGVLRAILLILNRGNRRRR